MSSAGVGGGGASSLRCCPGAVGAGELAAAAVVVVVVGVVVVVVAGGVDDGAVGAVLSSSWRAASAALGMSGEHSHTQISITLLFKYIYHVLQSSIKTYTFLSGTYFLIQKNHLLQNSIDCFKSEANN